jgi:hypothetical protein
MAVEDGLRKETEKWLGRIEEERKKITAEKSRENFIRNIDAYISDSRHFLANGDLIRAFEAVIWAYAWLEIGKELGVIS